MLHDPRLKILILSVLLICTCAACQARSDQTQMNAYDDDGYMGLSEAGPNMPTSPTYRHYNNDTRLMNAAIQNIDGVRSAYVMISGPTVYVKVNQQPGLSRAQIGKLKTTVRHQLAEMMPRYRVKVLGLDDTE